MPRQPRMRQGGPAGSVRHKPVTGFYRDGCCSSGPEDRGLRTVCAVVTAEFLEHQCRVGTDLSTPMPNAGSPAWFLGTLCVTARNWLRAYRDGCAAPVVASTHERTVDVVPLDVLEGHAVSGSCWAGRQLGRRS